MKKTRILVATSLLTMSLDLFAASSESSNPFEALNHPNVISVRLEDTSLEKLHEKMRALKKDHELTGNREAAFILGMIWLQGVTIGDRSSQTNPLKAVNWLVKAAQAGHSMAQYNLGLVYSKGIDPIIKKDTKQAREWFELATTNGNLDAQYNLAVYYNDGIDVDRDTRKAADLFTDAAKKRHLPSIELLTRFGVIA